MRSMTFSDGFTVMYANEPEARQLHRDIFDHKVYFKHGIGVEKDSVVIDAGANIGMFTLFVLKSSPTASIHAFEPAPKTFAILRANTRTYTRVEANNCGLGSEEKSERFTYLPLCTTGSGFYDNEMIAKQKARMLATENGELLKASVGEEFLRGRVDRLFEGESISVPIRRLSTYIDERKLDKIDLLKIDVEGQESAVLEGIREKHWTLIRQVVIEVHHRISDDLLPRTLGQLSARGFRTCTEPEEGLLTSIVYARR